MNEKIMKNTTKALTTLVELNDLFMFDEVYVDDEVCRITLPFVYKKYLLKFAEDKKLTYYMQGDKTYTELVVEYNGVQLCVEM